MWKIKYVVYFHYDCKRGKSARRGNSPLHLKWPTLELNWQFLMGSFVRGLKFRGPFWHPLNSNVAPVFSKLALLMVQFGPYNWVNLAQKWCQKQPHFNGAELTPSQCQTGLACFGPKKLNIWAKSTLFILQCTVGLFLNPSSVVLSSIPKGWKLK